VIDTALEVVKQRTIINEMPVVRLTDYLIVVGHLVVDECESIVTGSSRIWADEKAPVRLPRLL
jgi:hypothetical protein